MIDRNRFKKRVEASPILIDDVGFSQESKKVNDKLLNCEYQRFLGYIRRCKSCTARETNFLPVPPQGSLGSYYVFQGRNPGVREAENGVPFYRKAPGGRVFDLYLEYLGLGRDKVYVTNSLFCYTKKDRPPNGEERTVCSWWKLREYRYLLNMKILFLLGNDAFQGFFNVKESIIRYLGLTFLVRWDFGRNLICVPVLHPGYILRNRDMTDIVKLQLTYIKDKYIGNCESLGVIDGIRV